MITSETPHSITPVNKPMKSHNAGSEMYVGATTRNPSMICGVGAEARVFSTMAKNQENPPHRKKGIATRPRFFQYTTAKIATAIIPAPCRRKSGFISIIHLSNI
jgi:hypothetical protein